MHKFELPITSITAISPETIYKDCNMQHIYITRMQQNLLQNHIHALNHIPRWEDTQVLI